MPELPEVETFRRRLAEGAPGSGPLTGRRILRSRLLWPRTLAAPEPRRFHSGVRGRTVAAVERRGKFLVFRLDQGALLIHLRMSGSVVLEPPGTPLSPYTRLWLALDDGRRLSFRNPRKFGRVWLVGDPREVTGALGPEPLDPSLTAETFAARLQAKRRLIKPLLLDQTFVAGLGNIYADEALHRAGIHPLSRSDAIPPERARLLWQSIRRVLREAIRYNGTSFDGAYGGGEFLSRLRVYQQTGRPCRRCRTPIARTLVGQRGTHFCPRCQT